MDYKAQDYEQKSQVGEVRISKRNAPLFILDCEYA